MTVGKLFMNWKNLIKQNKLLAGLAYYAREKRNFVKTKKYGKLPIDGNKVLFYRPDGGYGDNTKAVAECLKRMRPDIQLVWACGRKDCFSNFPDYVKPVLFETEEYYKELATAGAWVCSTTLPYGTTKKKGQLYVQTWHGDKFLKKIAYDAAADVKDYKKRTTARKFCEPEVCDYFVTGCEWFVPIAASAFGYQGEFIRHGMPRNDCLVNLDEQKCNQIKKTLGLDLETRILIYAPTFRDYEKSRDMVGTNVDLVKILNALEEKHQCKWICLMRAHNGKHLTIHNECGGDDRFRDVTTYPDMADLLMISDMLISDYSSCGADFAITGKMVLMYQDDFELYTTKGRTLYFSQEESPYFTAYNMEEALKIIHGVTDDDVRKNAKGILDFYDSFETGRASEEVSKVILDSLDKLLGKKQLLEET